MTSSPHFVEEKEAGNDNHFVEYADAEFGGTEARLVLERKLLRKIDLRMSIMVLIYILNYVRVTHATLYLYLKARCLLL